MKNELNIKIISSLEKLYNGDTVPEKEYTKLSMLSDEIKSFQAVITSDIERKCKIYLSGGFKNAVIYSVENIPSELPITDGSDDYCKISNDGTYPDLLLPITDEVTLKKGNNVFWIELSAKENTAGLHTVTVNAQIGEEIAKASLSVEIIDCKLDFNGFVYTCWFHTDCLMTYYNIKAFSPEYWQAVENYLHTAVKYGMNCVLTPIFTPPLDTEVGGERPTAQLVDVYFNGHSYSFGFDRLTQWIEIAKKQGIEYFEFSHFYTQWGARHAPKIVGIVNGEEKQLFGWKTKAGGREYTEFLECFSVAFKEYVEKNGLRDKCFLHVSDEPNFGCIIPYRKASKTVHRLFKGYKIIDALSDYTFYRLKIVSTPIPSNDHIGKFIGKTDELWTYYCSSQRKNYVSNRFFCHPSLRNRVLGFQMFKYGVCGFLHWGYNFYYTQFSKASVDPYKVSDAGGKFPSGDSYIVYPAPKLTPYPSIRLMVFYDALQDMAALNALSRLTSHKQALEIIEENTDGITFGEYPHSEDWLLNARERVNEKIKEITATEKYNENSTENP